MKNQVKQFRPGVIVAFGVTLILVLGIPFWLKAQVTRDVIKDYIGWAGNPEEISVYIDDSFSAEEKEDVRAGMKRWNDAGSKPKFKEVNAPPAKVTVKEGNPGDGNAGIAAIDTDGDGKNTGVEITIRNNPNPGLKETATHEFGHAIGLDDVDAEKNPSDVMKGTGDSNGTEGALSDHDKTELAAAGKAITTPSAPPANQQPVKKRALAPLMALVPGSTGTLQFDLEFMFPLMTEVSVLSAGDPLVQVLFHQLTGNMLTVQVMILPGHGSGKFYLDIVVTPPLPMEPISYLGWHFVNTDPVGPITFVCPFQVQQAGNAVLVQWQDYHNYPDPAQPLRAQLTVDGNKHYHARGGEDFRIEGLAPGWHTFELTLDDFQINSVSANALFKVIAGPQEVPLSNWSMLIGILLVMAFSVYRFRPRS